MKLLKRGIISIFLAMVCGVCFAQSAPHDAVSDFIKAGYAYKEGDYKTSLEIYEGILKQGKASGAVHYNLGNCYFKEGELGKAILNYQRAKRLTARDHDLITNLNYARSFVETFSSSQKDSWVTKIFRQYWDSFTVNELTGGVFGLILVIGILHLLGLYLRWPKGNVRIIIAVLGFLFVVHFILFVFKVRDIANAAIVVEETKTRFEPLEAATIHFKVSEGSRVKILKQEGSWWKIKRSDGKVGWMKQNAAERIDK